jgi:Rrf2 family transcriptional regulator, nitric oxide-sensitive transcriptional repressor
MRLTRHTDYALRLLMLLAMEPEATHTIGEAARRYHISRNHMMKVAQTLVQAGFVGGLRGRRGGLRLERQAEAINLGAVVRATEESLDLVECFDRATNTCVVAPACRLRGALQDALKAFFHVLDAYSLADLINSPNSVRRMRRLLTDSEGLEGRT